MLFRFRSNHAVVSSAASTCLPGSTGLRVKKPPAKRLAKIQNTRVSPFYSMRSGRDAVTRRHCQYSAQVLMCRSVNVFREIDSTNRWSNWRFVMSGMAKSTAFSANEIVIGELALLPESDLDDFNASVNTDKCFRHFN